MRPYILISLIIGLCIHCSQPGQNHKIIHVHGDDKNTSSGLWLSHEHLLVDFIGADQISPESWDRREILNTMLPHLQDAVEDGVKYFVDATPNYLGRDVKLLQDFAQQAGVKIITNTGLYGARQNKYIPQWAFEASAEELARYWIMEYMEGIEDTEVKPGFIKIGIDASETLDPMHLKLVKAAALTHLETGLTIASHTGPSIGLWPQLKILDSIQVSAQAFIWVHAQNEDDHGQYLLAAERGCWISLDGLGWDTDGHIEKLVFAKENDLLDFILISHDAGWYDPQKDYQSIVPYTNIFDVLVPALAEKGFSKDEMDQLLIDNPTNAYSVRIRKR